MHSNNRTTELEKEKKQLLEKYNYYETNSRRYMVLIVLSPIASLALFQMGYYDLTLATFIWSIAGVFLYLKFKPNGMDTQIRDIQNEIDLLEVENESGERRAEKLFKNHQFELKKYYDQALNQGRSIFYIGVFCVLIGVVIILSTLWAITKASDLKIDEKVIAGLTGIMTSILINFIGVIYLKMYSETVNSLKEFHSRLVTTHHLHYSSFLIEKITDIPLKEKTLSDLALLVINNGSDSALQSKEQ